jgi:hypothetical protein
LDENRKKLLEGLAPSVKRRLDLIKEFSKAGVFVQDKEMIMENSGYASINKTDWGYVV